MGLNRSSKVSAEFNMSSLTDIIFLLLIFFMLTSNFVQIKPFELPESDSQTVAPTNIVVQLQKDGSVNVNNIDVKGAAVLRAVTDALNQVEDKDQATVTIVAEKGVPFQSLTPIMNTAAKQRARAIIATQPQSR